MVKTVVLILVVGGISAAVLAVNWDSFTFSTELHEIHVKAGRPTYRGSPEGVIYRNTFDHAFSPSLLYDEACGRLDVIRGSCPRKSYAWEDSLTYPGESTIAQFPLGHVIVTRFQGNDSITVKVEVAPGPFIGGHRLKLREISSRP